MKTSWSVHGGKPECTWEQAGLNMAPSSSVQRNKRGKCSHRPVLHKTSSLGVVVQVSVYGRSRLGQDVFLGEVLIPLREVEETGASGVAEVHKYILGRRSTKERVTGEIALACSWRVTPLDVVIMKVRLTPHNYSFKAQAQACQLVLSITGLLGSWLSPSCTVRLLRLCQTFNHVHLPLSLSQSARHYIGVHL